MEDVFDEHFPYYLSKGMSYDLYWHGDTWLVKAYHKAHTLKFEHDNTLAWLKGLYVYEAVTVANNNLHRDPKKGQRKQDYREKPIRITPLSAAEKKAEEQKAWAKIKASLNTLKENFNPKA